MQAPPYAAPPRRLTFFTTNPGKAAELRELLAPAGVAVEQDARGYPELQADTLAEVTEAGADWLLAQGCRPPFLLEDSGLFVDALKGFPGVYSRHALDTIGVAGLLALLRDVPAARRTARFEADLLLVQAGGSRRHFAGACHGRIALAASGAGGFGFDPLFIPAAGPAGTGGSLGRTFSEMERPEKSALSHRGQAVRALADALMATGKP